MSSPASNLKKTRRSPLPGGKRSVPFRCHPKPPSGVNGEGVGGDSPWKDEGAWQSEMLDTATQRLILEGIQRNSRFTKPSGVKAAPSDAELLGSMATRLALAERELLASKREIIMKDQCISQLEERLAVLKHEGDGGCHGDSVRELELTCVALQHQVDEMEGFLNDYGMVWVGSQPEGEERGRGRVGGEGGAREREGGERERGGGENEGGEERDGVWLPHSSVVGEAGFQVDFDLTLRNIKELNALAGEGSCTVSRTETRGRLEPLEPVPLTLYCNGLALFGGPFRPYSDPATRALLLDIADGYFPSELQPRYPEGIPLKVSDQRDVIFRAREYRDYFPGTGNLLGGQTVPPSLLPPKGTGGRRETTELPGPKLSLERFLTQLPSSVLCGGRVINIRSGVAEALQADVTPSSSRVTLVETPVLQEIKSRLDVAGEPRPPTPGHVCTLRVKSETGNQTFVLKMRHSDTIADVRRHIDRLRPAGADRDYRLLSSFPCRQTHSDLSGRLDDSGLTPSANLFLQARQTHS